MVDDSDVNGSVAALSITLLGARRRPPLHEHTIMDRSKSENIESVIAPSENIESVITPSENIESQLSPRTSRVSSVFV